MNDHAKPRLLDLFCGAGGCSVGYHRAGFDVVGVDNQPMKRYPFDFHQADALEFLEKHGHEFDAIHASPPCQAYCIVNRLRHLRGRAYPDLIEPVRELLKKSGRPWVMENVVGSPLQHPIMLCGSSFGLLVRRHRLFESSVVMLGLPCNHRWQDAGGARFPSAFRSRKYLKGSGCRHLSTVVQVYGHTAGKKHWPTAMGINWMRSRELTQAIPPAYTEYIGRQLIEWLRGASE
jgi:DNA (cytosine-5)-methyltransferase 1